MKPQLTTVVFSCRFCLKLVNKGHDDDAPNKADVLTTSELYINE